MRYAYVKDGKVVEGPKGLPKSWGNTSGFNLQTDVELKSLGWLPWRLVEVQSPGPDWIAMPATIEIKADEIVETQAYRQKTQSEKDEEARQRQESNKQARAEAYREESDPLFFKAQRNEATMQDWLDKVEEIRQRYPV
jgi:hypothetical protein